MYTPSTEFVRLFLNLSVILTKEKERQNDDGNDAPELRCSPVVFQKHFLDPITTTLVSLEIHRIYGNLVRHSRGMARHGTFRVGSTV